MFYFHLRAEQAEVLDDEVLLLPDAESARKEGRIAAREMVAEAVLRDEPLDCTTIEVRAEHDSVVDAVRLTSVVRI